MPVVPVYDMRVKDADLVVGTHGRSFWILDDVSPLRELTGDQPKTKLITPRRTVRTRLAWSAGMSFSKTGISYSPAFGIGAATEGVEFVDGSRMRHFLDVGENPPSGAIIYYWLPKDAEGPVKLAFQDAAGKTVVAYSSDNKDAPHAKRPAGKAGLNRFVWDLKHQGPTKIDQSLVTRKYKPFASESDDVSGPAVLPGAYRVTLEVGGESQTAGFEVVTDPRVKVSRKDLEEQFALLDRLYAKAGALNQGVNRMRQIKRQIADVQKRAGNGNKGLAEQGTALVGKLEAIEGVLVDIKRETPRDVLRNPAGLNDTLVDLINVVAIADEAPTQQARQVSEEIMARVDVELARLDALLKGEIATLNAGLRGAGIEPLGVAAS
jgi:hypothetical protein